MHIERHTPALALSPFIRSYLIISCDAEQENRLLPDTGMAIAFRYKGQVAELSEGIATPLPLASITGLRKSPRTVRYAKDSGNVLVLFKEAGAAAFFRESLHDWFGASIALDQLVRASHIAAVEEQLALAADHQERSRIIDRFLLSRLRLQATDALVTAALQQIHASGGRLRIKDLATSLYISQDAFEKRFRKIVGTSPKQFCFIVRMKAITAGNTPAKTFTDMAFQAGYSDQPHFNKDFRSFTGQAPTDFFQAPPRW